MPHTAGYYIKFPINMRYIAIAESFLISTDSQTAGSSRYLGLVGANERYKDVNMSDRQHFEFLYSGTLKVCSFVGGLPVDLEISK